MLYREKIAVFSQIHTEHINTLCGLNAELLYVKLAVRIMTSGLYRVKKIRTIWEKFGGFYVARQLLTNKDTADTKLLIPVPLIAPQKLTIS